MARFTRIEVAQQMHQTGIVPVYYNEGLKTCKEVLRASYAAGIRVFEFTNRGDQAHKILESFINYAKTNCPE